MSKVYKHEYPLILLKYPAIIHLLYFNNWFIHIRKWHLYFLIKKSVKQLNSNFIYIDFGSGDGQYLFPLAKKKPNATCIGVDKNSLNIQFGNRYISHFKLNNVTFYESDIETFKCNCKADLMVCASVLQYVQNDLDAFISMNKAITSGGLLLLYLPINGKIILPFYKKLLFDFPNYENTQERKRVYTEVEIAEKLQLSGFEVVDKKYTYGFLGIISNEVINSFLIIFNHYNFIIKSITLLIFIISYPIILFIMIIDYLWNNKNGNGILITAKKSN